MCFHVFCICLFVCVCTFVWTWVFHGLYLKDRGQYSGANSLLLSSEFWRLNSGLQAWQHAFLTTEPSHGLLIFKKLLNDVKPLFMNLLTYFVLYVCVLLYVNTCFQICGHTCVVACVCMCTHTCRGLRLTAGVSFCCSSPYSLIQTLSLEHRACQYGWSHKPVCSGNVLPPTLELEAGCHIHLACPWVLGTQTPVLLVTQQALELLSRLLSI